MRVNWKGVSLFLLFALAFSCLMVGYVYTIGQQRVIPVQNNTTTYMFQTIEGDPTTHLTSFEVMVGPGVDLEKVCRALLLCPNAYGFVLIPYDESRLMPTPFDGYDDAPFPAEGEDFLIVIVDGDQYDAGAAGWTLTNNVGRITIQAERDWPDMILAYVICHECTHQFEDEVLDYPDQYHDRFDTWVWDQWYGTPTLGEHQEGQLYCYYVLDDYLNS